MSKDLKPKKIFQPDNPEQVLLGWLLHSHKGRQRHDLAARQLERLRVWIGAAAAAVSAVVGASVFSALEKEPSNRLKTVLAMVSIVATVLVSLSAFLNLAERSEKHRSAGVRYKAMIRELERRLSEAVDSRTPLYVVDLEKRLNELEESAPIVPHGIFVKVDADWDARGAELIRKAIKFYAPSEPKDEALSTPTRLPQR